MRQFFLRRTIIIILVVAIIILGVAVYFVFLNNRQVVSTKVLINLNLRHTVIGKSVEGRPIETYTYGNGETRIVFVGGIHGGYEWNSVLLAYKFIDYLDANKDLIPKNIIVTVIPSANPDGVYKIIGKEGHFTISDVPTVTSDSSGRFNAHNVDLNRNFDCKWQATSTWQNKIESAGSAPFSEPEARAVRDFVLINKPVAVIFLHSKSNAVYASECKSGILPETLNIMNVYSKASGYKAVETFDSYVVTGDAEGWLASINIPAITVELATHETIEWEQNLAGIQALFGYYKK